MKKGEGRQRRGGVRDKTKGGFPRKQGRDGSRLSVVEISLSPLWLMRGRGPVGNYSSKATLAAMSLCNGSSG